MFKSSNLAFTQNLLRALMIQGEGGQNKNVGKAATGTASADDIKEEAGLMFGEKAESKKKAEQRRLNKHNVRHRHLLNKVELHKMYAMLDERDAGRQQSSLQRLRDALKRKSETDELLAILDDDPARCDLLLRVMEREARSEGDEELHQMVEQHLGTLEQNHGERLRAGLNIAGAIAELTDNPQHKQSLRTIYYDSIVHQQSAMSMVDLLLRHFAPQDFTTVLRTLQRALADDIAALASSIGTGALRHIQTGLFEAGQVNHTLEESRMLLDRMAGKMDLGDMDHVELARRLLQICHNGAFQQDFSQLGQDVIPGAQPRNLSIFFNGVLPLVRALPIGLWKIKDGRQTALKLLENHNTTLLKDERRQARRSSKQ
ncbi:type III secretion system gatekeeper subunit SctW [Pantoea stewartii]|uniref:type III secretion system gatekeeper subunit SctW n=1 Tax=Pantoea stewartii TaxID=66269 RepID=UPI0021D507D9|nr:type III secretion system gatekeeper subunit SctW [Pantoea stewartii]MCU7369207.1 type III secretion system gatekeeper subunit SctW [Pantoea stewartii]